MVLCKQCACSTCVHLRILKMKRKKKLNEKRVEDDSGGRKFVTSDMDLKKINDHDSNVHLTHSYKQGRLKPKAEAQGH